MHIIDQLVRSKFNSTCPVFLKESKYNGTTNIYRYSILLRIRKKLGIDIIDLSSSWKRHLPHLIRYS